MGTVRISIDGEPKFTWEGDEGEIARLFDAVAKLAAAGDQPISAIQSACFRFIARGTQLSEVAREAAMMGVLTLVMDQDIRHPGHPGKLRDYVPTTNFKVDLHLDETTDEVHAQVEAFTHYDS
jgi:hypothetical protein